MHGLGKQLRRYAERRWRFLGSGSGFNSSSRALNVVIPHLGKADTVRSRSAPALHQTIISCSWTGSKHPYYLASLWMEESVRQIAVVSLSEYPIRRAAS